jgi:hypothetical protein
VVPISEPPYRMFESRPREIDAETAREAVRLEQGADSDAPGWLVALMLGIERQCLDRASRGRSGSSIPRS